MRERQAALTTPQPMVRAKGEARGSLALPGAVRERRKDRPKHLGVKSGDGHLRQALAPLISVSRSEKWVFCLPTTSS